MPDLTAAAIRRLAVAATLLNVLLAAGVVRAAIGLAAPSTPTVVAPAPAAPVAGAAPVGEAAAGSPARLAALVLERGLFGRPDPEAAAPGAPTVAAIPPPPPPPALVGTALAPMGRAGAVFAEGGVQFLVAVGDRVNDAWRLVAVRRGEAILEGPGGYRQQVLLPLPAAEAPAAAGGQPMRGS